MNSLTKNQLCALLLITDMFGLCCVRGSISTATLWGVLGGTAIQFLIALAFAVQGRGLSRAAEVFFLLYAVFCGGTVFSELWQSSAVIYIPYESSRGVWGRLMTAGLVAAVCLYISSTGMKSAGRAAVIAAAVGISCLAIDLASAAVNADWQNLWRPERRSTFAELIRGFAVSGELGSFAVFLGEVRGDRVRTTVRYFAAKAVISAAVLLTALAVAGGIMPVTDFPVITAAQLSQPFEAQRIDSLFLVVFSVFAVFSAALQVMTGAFLLSRIFPSFRRWKSTAVILCTVGAACLIWGRELLLLRGAGAAAALIFAAFTGKKISAVQTADR